MRVANKKCYARASMAEARGIIRTHSFEDGAARLRIKTDSRNTHLITTQRTNGNTIKQAPSEPLFVVQKSQRLRKRPSSPCISPPLSCM